VWTVGDGLPSTPANGIEEDAMGIKVRAKAADGIGRVMGYYDHQRRREGEEFEIECDAHFSRRWMERIDESEDGRRPPEAPKYEPALKRGLSRTVKALTEGD
jgi:hypothetical protein